MGGALAGFGLHLHRGTDAMGALLHDLHAHMAALRQGLSGGKAQAVVAHQKAPLRTFGHLQHHLGGLCMLTHIGECLLHHVQYLHLDVGRQ
jgi:hypothetical protein